MSKANALAGLIGNYGDSDEESDDGGSVKAVLGRNKSGVTDLGVQGFAGPPPSAGHGYSAEAGAIHPAPIPHCPWSACYDENSGFTYYWNQHTNAVTWEAPPEYLLALKLAQQHLHTSGSTEVSAEEWQLYQQALAEKQNTQTKVISKPPAVKPAKKSVGSAEKNSKGPNKRRFSDGEEKIELITSYHNSDSDSNDEQESPVKAPVVPSVATPKPPKLPKVLPKVQPKKPKTKVQTKEYGPSLPPNQNYTVPIGPDLPPDAVVETKHENASSPGVAEKDKPKSGTENEDSQDESLLLTRLKDKAKLLEKLGGEIPAELQEIIRDETNSIPSSPKVVSDTKTDAKHVGDIEDLLQEIEMKELPKIKTKSQIDIFNDEAKASDSAKSSPRSNGNVTPPRDEVKPLFPSSKNIVDVPTTLFPSATIAPVHENGVEKEVKENSTVAEKKGTNLYLMGAGEVVENMTRKKLRISNSVLPQKKVETPAYTTKYAQSIEGFTSERTGLGFSKEETTEKETAPKNAISYGNGLMFTKGETLNEEKKDDDVDDLMSLVEAKLMYLTQLQPSTVSPVQEMMIQMQTLLAAFRSGALTARYARARASAAQAALRAHEAAAAPAGWRCAFQRSEGRYRYERESDGLVQWEYPAAAHCDMDICTTPPHPAANHKEESLPPLPPSPPPPPPPPSRPRTPPPPAWSDPPPPGCDDPTPPPPPEPKQEIGDELLSFYNDIAELEKQTSSTPHTASNSPEPPAPPPAPEVRERRDKEKEREKEKDGKVKKKSKVKISSSIGMKHKSVSNLVAKWQQVAEEINSD